VLYPQNFEEKIGFDKIRLLLESKCLSDLGKTHVSDISFMTNHASIDTELLLSFEMMEIMRFGTQFPTSYYIDLRNTLSRLYIDGTYIFTDELFDLQRSLDTIRSLVRFFAQTPEDKYPNLKEITKQVVIVPFLYESIDQILNKYGEIKDNASPELLAIRNEIKSKRSGISRRIQSIMKQAQSHGWVDSDTEITVRDGKLLIPVEVSNKRKIQGTIVDESASGKTIYIEPSEITELNNEIKELEFAEKREIIRILTHFTEKLRPYLPDLELQYVYMGRIDFIRAKALLAIDLDAIKPSVLENKPLLNWYEARHPLLYLNFKKEKRQIVPLNISFTQEQRIIVISGPNAGGKSVALKTTGLIQYMLQCGLLVTVRHASEMGIFDSIFMDIGDEQSLDNDLSTYSSHLLNMKHFLKHANEKTIVLIDEFGTGTEPLLGGAIAEAILEDLTNRRCWGVITTHYANLKHFATYNPGIINGAMEFDSHMLQPLYQLSLGKPGSSFAIEIARKIGLPDSIISSASEKVGQDHINFDKNLKSIERDRRYYETKRKEIKNREKHLEELIAKYDEKQTKLIAEQKLILNDAKKQASEILSGANKQIENAIFQIKQVNAEKEKTREIRQIFNDAKEQISEKIEQKEADIDSKMQQILQRKKRKEDKKNKEANTPTTPLPVPEKLDPEYKVGDKVKMKYQKTVGEIIQINTNSITVMFGSIQAVISKDKVEPANTQEIKHLQEQLQTKARINLPPTKSGSDFVIGLDVRGLRGEAAVLRVQQYIDEAIVAQASEVRILHGTGNGILRQMIREFLNTIDVVKSARDEKVEFGGSGITVVMLDY